MRRVPVHLLLVLLLAAAALQAAEVIPPPPDAYFNDHANITSQATRRELNAQLEQFERQTSNQIVVAIYPKMQSPSSIEDYTIRILDAWKKQGRGIGQKDRDNGAVLFVFTQDRAMFLQVGYGLEGAIPDITAKRIIDNEITPRFREGQYDAGLVAGVTAIMQAARGEYRGSGRTVAEGQGGRPGASVSAFILVLIMLLFAWANITAARRSRRMRRIHTGRGWVWGPVGGGLSGGFGRGGFGGGFGGFSGGGGFRGGGGSFGGGGAGGGW